MQPDAIANPVQRRLAAATRSHGQHLVGFYDTDVFLVDSVVQFLAPGLDDGEAAVVVATPEHRTLIRHALTERGIDLEAAEEHGRLVLLDAADTLDRFLVDDTPDREQFQTAMAAIMQRAAHGGRRVRIFGEMVALLWQTGRVLAASALEGLWNELAESYPFGLLCMYPTSAVSTEDRTLAFLTVCEQHNGVIPSEDYSTLPDLDDRLRRVAVLQQEAVAAQHDRLALRRRQEELEEALDHLRQLDRVRTEMLAMVVHEIRSPAAAICELLAFLQGSGSGPDHDATRRALSLATASSRRIQRLADDLSTMTTLSSEAFTFELRPLDLVATVERTVAETYATTGHRIEVSCDVDLPTAWADEDRQVQILSNLLTYASKASPLSSPVRIEVTTREEHLLVSVHDRGPGIDATDQHQIFRPFSQLAPPDTPDDEGTGLGLYITKHLIEGQGGHIAVDSARGRGTTFSYTVPSMAP